MPAACMQPRRDNQRLSASRLAQPIRQLQLNPNTQTQAQTIQISQPKVLGLVTLDPGLGNARRRKTIRKKRTTGRRKVNKLASSTAATLVVLPLLLPRRTTGDARRTTCTPGSVCRGRHSKSLLRRRTRWRT
jgi:hypothetical protein